MKTLYLSVALSVSASLSMAQIVLKDNHTPVFNGSYQLQTPSSTSTDFDFEMSDAEDVTWDMRNTGMKKLDNDIIYDSPVGTKYGSLFTEATLAGSTTAAADEGIYDYYSFNNQQLNQLGFTHWLQSFPTIYTAPFKFDKPLTKLKFPMTFKDSFYSETTYKGAIYAVFGEDNDTDSLIGWMDRKTVVDGYGTLVMPDNTVHKVLRLYIEVSRYDSIFSDTSHRITAYTSKYYEFHSEEYAEPMVTAYLHNGVVASVQAIDPANSTKVLGLGLSSASPYVAVYPNPSSQSIRLDCKEASSVDIYNANAQRVLSIRITNGQTVDVSTLPRGLYSLLIKDLDDAPIAQARLIKVD